MYVCIMCEYNYLYSFLVLYLIQCTDIYITICPLDASVLIKSIFSVCVFQDSGPPDHTNPLKSGEGFSG